MLHLDDAVQAAVQNQPQLIQARANAAAAEGRVIEARSPLLPQLTPQASWTRSYRALTSVATGGRRDHRQRGAVRQQHMQHLALRGGGQPDAVGSVHLGRLGVRAAASPTR